MPCADCDAVDYKLTLNKDETYEAVISYLGVGQAEPNRTTGKWAVSDRHILIMDGKLKDTLSLLPEDEALIVLGPQGQRMGGPEAKYYKLTRSSERKEIQVPQANNQPGFNAAGVSPSWKLEIMFDKYIRFYTPESDTVAVPVPMAQTNDLTGLYYVSSGEGHTVNLSIERDTCTFDGNTTNYSVSATVDGTDYTGCGTYSYNKDLAGRWVLSGIDGLTIDEKDFSRGMPEINVADNGMSISGNTGCNTFNGVLWVEGGKLRINGITLTRISCPADMESRFVEMLENRPAYTFESDSLSLKGPTSTFHFSKVEGK
ncbi:MAG: META domain-containing protein [Cyclobacteriaceae bacterium]